MAHTNILDVLTYYHHAGTIAAASGDFARASELFIFGAAVPGETPSAIRIACAKRAILCELLSTGRQAPFPRDVSQTMSRSIEKGMDAYRKLATAFENRLWSQVTDIVSHDNVVGTFERVSSTGLESADIRTATVDSCRRLWSRSRSAAS